jgi:hypothetical protein
MGGKDAKRSKVRVSITLREDIYNEIKKLSHELGIKPASWMAMTLTSKVNSLRKNRDD